MNRHLLLPILAAALAAPALSQNVITLPDSIYAAGDTITWVKKLTSYCEGPAWDPVTGNMFFSQQMGNSVPNWPVWKIKPGVDTGAVWLNSYQANGMEFDPTGKLVVAQNGRITRYNANATVDSVMALSGSNGVTFGQANDLSFASTGAFYFTDLGTKIFHVNALGQLSLAYASASGANGIEWIEEEGAVYVNEGSNIRRYVTQLNGSLASRTTFATASGLGSDGGTVDAHGNRYVANYSGGEVRVFNAKGDSIGRIAPRLVSGSYNVTSGNTGNVSNCAFGGPDLKTLYITGDGGLFSIRLKIPGRVRPGATALRTRLPAASKPGSQVEAARDARGRRFTEEGTAPTARFANPRDTKR